jgi:hypothetical protein
MATWVETTDSFSATIQRKGKRADSTVKQSFRVFDAKSDIEVHDEANIRFSAGSLYTIGDYTLMVESYEISCVAPGVFDVTATYVKTGADADTTTPLGRTRSFDTTGATARQTYAIDNSETRYGSSAPNMKGVLNYDGDSVQGVDIIIPSLQWTETYDIPSTYVTSVYIKTVAQLTGTVNSSAFRTFQAGEVLFAGASGSQEWDTEKGNGPWRLTYKFVASPNAGNGQTWPPLQLGDIQGIEKKGHEVLWVRYEDKVENEVSVKTPKHVYVNSVYRSADFGTLGLGIA